MAELRFSKRNGTRVDGQRRPAPRVPHGPHPGTYEKSVGDDRTGELAVMCDTFKPLWLTTVIADPIADGWRRRNRPTASSAVGRPRPVADGACQRRRWGNAWPT